MMLLGKLGKSSACQRNGKVAKNVSRSLEKSGRMAEYIRGGKTEFASFGREERISQVFWRETVLLEKNMQDECKDECRQMNEML